MSAVCPPGELGSVGGRQRESWSPVEMMEKSGSNSTRKPPWLGGSSLRDRPLSGLCVPQALSVTPCWRDVGQGQGGTRRDRRADTGEGLGLKGQEGVMAMQVQRVWPGLWQGSGTASRRDLQGGARCRGRCEIFVLVLQEQQQGRERPFGLWDWTMFSQGQQITGGCHPAGPEGWTG